MGRVRKGKLKVFSEEFSDNGKGGRGRPRLLSAELQQTFAAIWHKEGRALQNAVYGTRAFKLLHELPQYAWLFEDNGERRWTLVEELGRVPDDELLRSVALELCKKKPRVRDALVMLRHWRLHVTGREQRVKADADRLQRELRNVLNDYLLRHPETTQEQLLEAIRGLHTDVLVSGLRWAEEGRDGQDSQTVT